MLVLTALSVAVGVAVDKLYKPEAPLDERLVIAVGAAILFAFVVAVINKALKLNLLSHMAEKVTFVLIPPLLLIFLVLGTIFLGVATPTEGGAMGAMGALVMAWVRRRMSFSLLKQALGSTTRLSSFVMFILIGATVFSLVFQAADGPIWVEHLLTSLPGGPVGFLIAVNVLIFFLAFFLDFFELSFIVVPLLAPVAHKMGIDLIWFGVLLAVNMQTSFMHPPFGFSLFYLRSVAPREVKTSDIYWGAVPFVVIQLIMVTLIIVFPGLVSTGGHKAQDRSITRDLSIDLEQSGPKPGAPTLSVPAPGAGPGGSGTLELPGAPADSEPSAPQFEFEKKN
ncbi:TRAP transporter, DctM subunit [compost metagenome]